MAEKPGNRYHRRAMGARLARARGLDRALALFPATVAAAVARGASSLGPQPAEFSAVTEPAVAFDPATFHDDNGSPR